MIKANNTQSEMKARVTLRDNIASIIKTLLESRKMTQKEIGDIIGCKIATVSEIYNKKKVPNYSLLNKAYTILSKYKEAGEKGIIKTCQFKTIFNVCEDVKKHSQFFMINGNTGIGKSIVLSNYAYSPENKNVWYLKIEEPITWSVFLGMLINKLGLDEVKGSAKKKTDAIKSFLVSKDKPLIIVDELEVASNAFVFNFKKLAVALCDRSESEPIAGLLLSSTPDKKTAIYRSAKIDQTTNMPKPGSICNKIRTLLRRLSFVDIPDLSQQDVIDFFENKGVVDKELLKYVSTRFYNYGDIDVVLRKAASTLDKSGKRAKTPSEYNLSFFKVL